MKSLVGDGINGGKIGDAVVLFVAVEMVDDTSVGDWAALPLPDDVMLVSESAIERAPEIAFPGNVESIGSGRFRSSESHAHSPLSWWSWRA